MKAENYNIALVKRPNYKQSSPNIHASKKIYRTPNKDELKSDLVSEEMKMNQEVYTALLKSNKQHKYSTGANGVYSKKASRDIKHVIKIESFDVLDDPVVREKKVAEIIQELKKNKYNDSVDIQRDGIYCESPNKHALISETLNRFENKIIMADPLRDLNKNLNGSLIQQSSTMKDSVIERADSPNFVRPITEPKERAKDLLSSGKQNLPSIQSKSKSINILQPNLTALENRKYTPSRASRNEVNTSTEKNLPAYNQTNHPRCLSHRMIVRKDIAEDGDYSPPKNDKTVEVRLTTPGLSPKRQGNVIAQAFHKEDEHTDGAKAKLARYQPEKKNNTVMNHLLSMTPQIKKVVTDKKGVNSSLRNGQGNLTLINGACNVSDTKSGVENFAFEKVIGQGSYATVRLAVERGGSSKVAIKTYEKFKLFDTQRRKNVRREISLLQELDHPNIIKLYKTVDTVTQIHLIMEYAETQSLHSYLKSKPSRKLEESVARDLFKQVVEGIDYLHRKNIVHRDIKLENLMLTSDNQIKIIDFGFSVKTPKDKTLGVFCGTPSYMSPELAMKRDYYGHLADIWALGILLYVLLAGCFPIKGTDDKDLFKKIARGTYDIPSHFSKEAHTLVKKLLRLNPQDRPSTTDILHDEWVTGSQNSYRNLKDFLSNKIEEYKKIGTTSRVDELKEEEQPN